MDFSFKINFSNSLKLILNGLKISSMINSNKTIETYLNINVCEFFVIFISSYIYHCRRFLFVCIFYDDKHLTTLSMKITLKIKNLIRFCIFTQNKNVKNNYFTPFSTIKRYDIINKNTEVILIPHKKNPVNIPNLRKIQ